MSEARRSRLLAGARTAPYLAGLDQSHASPTQFNAPDIKALLAEGCMCKVAPPPGVVAAGSVSAFIAKYACLGELCPTYWLPRGPTSGCSPLATRREVGRSIIREKVP